MKADPKDEERILKRLGRFRESLARRQVGNLRRLKQLVKAKRLRRQYDEIQGRAKSSVE